MHTHMDEQGHNQFQHFAIQHLTKILQTIQNNNQNKQFELHDVCENS